MIPEPQLTYVLELLAALGPTADDFVVAGAQAMKFTVPEARATKDVDFVLNVLGLRAQPQSLAEILAKLGYTPVPESRNFQFVKPLPDGRETMRIEFMAPEEFKRNNNIRVDIQKGVHARACTGGSIAVEQSDLHAISGRLPDGTPYTGQIRVTHPHALVMLKLLALADRYQNIRGPKEARHDREEAQTHASDIMAILRVVTDIPSFNTAFVAQFHNEAALGISVLRILADYFRDSSSPGLILYAEHVASNLPADRSTTETINAEIDNALQVVLRFRPNPDFLSLAAAIDDSTHGTPLVDEYLANLEQSRIPFSNPLALTLLPAGSFGGAYARGTTFVTNAAEPIARLEEPQRQLLFAYLQRKIALLQANAELRSKYPRTLTS
jgi:Nucleotidyl transferase AbiEii toxin, Type IV TA system